MASCQWIPTRPKYHIIVTRAHQHQYFNIDTKKTSPNNYQIMSEATQSPEDAAAQRAAEQARLRKERREAKLKAGGSARLNKITGLGGRIPGGSIQLFHITPA